MRWPFEVCPFLKGRIFPALTLQDVACKIEVSVKGERIIHHALVQLNEWVWKAGDFSQGVVESQSELSFFRNLCCSPHSGFFWRKVPRVNAFVRRLKAYLSRRLRLSFGKLLYGNCAGQNRYKIPETFCADTSCHTFMNLFDEFLFVNLLLWICQARWLRIRRSRPQSSSLLFNVYYVNVLCHYLLYLYASVW